MAPTLTTRRGTRVEIIATGTFLLDGGTMFGRIPKNLWERWFPADDQNRIVMAGNCLKITTPERTVLVDAGMGSRYNAKEQTIYGLRTVPADLGPIDDLVCTHLHFDHCGGIHDLTCRRVLVSHLEWEDTRHHDPLTRGSYRPIDLAAIAPHLTLIEPPTTLDEHIAIIPSPGHTRGHVSVLVDDEIFFPGDLVPTAAHCHLPCVMAYDLDPLTVVQTKQRLLTTACERDWLVVFEHDPYRPAGHVTQSRGKFKVED